MMWRLSRVADYSQYEALQRRRQRKERRGEPGAWAAVAEGHVPVYVGEEMERFEVPTRLLNRPAIVELLSRSAQEYGYQQRGVLRIPCPVPLFRRLLAAEEGKAAAAVEEAEEELLQSSFDERFLSSFDRC